MFNNDANFYVEGEASQRNMCSTIEAMTDGTKWGGNFSTDYVWWKTLEDHPENFIPAKAKKHNDRCKEWLTLQNINDWIDNHKNYMLGIEFVKNEPGYICE